MRSKNGLAQIFFLLIVAYFVFVMISGKDPIRDNGISGSITNPVTLIRQEDARMPKLTYCFDYPFDEDFRQSVAKGARSWYGAFNLSESAIGCQIHFTAAPLAQMKNNDVPGSMAEAIGNLCNGSRYLSIVFNEDRLKDKSSYDPLVVPSLVAHELGHTFCLGHSQDPNNIMYPVMGMISPSPMPSEADIAAVRMMIRQ